MAAAPLQLKGLAKEIARLLRNEFQWPAIMSVETAAHYMDRTPEAVRGLIDRKMLPAARLDGRVQIRKCDIDRIFERVTE